MSRSDGLGGVPGQKTLEIGPDCYYRWRHIEGSWRVGIRSGRLLACFALITTGLLALPAVAGATSGGAPGVRSDAAEAGIGATPATCSETSGPHVAHCYLSVEEAPQSNMALPSTTKATLCQAN